jgi:hypothetical protein
MMLGNGASGDGQLTCYVPDQQVIETNPLFISYLQASNGCLREQQTALEFAPFTAPAANAIYLLSGGSSSQGAIPIRC